MTSAPLPASVFVYGTLMPGEANAEVAEQAAAPVRRERATLHGYTVYHLHPEGYPALVAGEHAAATPTVHGWLLTYAPAHWPAALAHLDELEGVDDAPPLYARVPVQAHTWAGPQAAWVYVYARPERLQERGCVRVPSGDWTQVQGRHPHGRDPARPNPP